MDYNKKYFSVLGDSISTFQGYSPWAADYYNPDLVSTTGVATVEDTWWMKVIRALNGVYLSNGSLSGNTISTLSNIGGFPPQRLRQLSTDGKKPDHILLYAGLNDANFYVPAERFAEEYQLLLTHLKELYPEAQIHCGTLILGAVDGAKNSLQGFRQRLIPYNETIREAVAKAGVKLVDLAAFNARYSAMDALHPTGLGMEQLASLWLRAMEHRTSSPLN